MKILITGAGGFIGTHLMAQLAPNHQVYGLYHDNPIRCSLGYSIQGDVTDYARMREIIVDHEIEQIYHFAAKSIVRNCRCDPLGCFHSNIIGTATVLEAARQSERIKGIIVMESDKAYGHGKLPYSESQALCPEGIYESSKACVSHIMTAYHRNYGLPVFSVRSANVYGPGDRNHTRIVPSAIVHCLRGEKPYIVDGAANYIRELVYIEDACWCITHLMEAGKWGEVINVGSGEKMTVHAIITRILDLMGVIPQIETSQRPDTFVEIPEQWLNIGKLKTLLPNYSPTPLNDGLKQTIDWYKKDFNPSSSDPAGRIC